MTSQQEQSATIRKIAVEEAFMTPELAAEWRKVLNGPNPEPGFVKMGNSILAENPGTQLLHQRLLDIGAGRIERMDQTGLDMHVLSLASPGVQAFAADIAIQLARSGNDLLIDAVRGNPTRFAGLAAVATQSPDDAAREIERTRNMGLHGVLINSHTNGEYLDDPRFSPIFEVAQATSAPIYLHPREPSPQMVAPYLDYGLYFAGWGFAAETGLHAMRLIMSGLFDRFPGLRIILGHLGEGIPYWLDRIDNRYLLQVKIGAVQRLKRLPSEYFRENFFITTAGMTSRAPLQLCLDTIGPERILFAADYPFEDDAEAVAFIDEVELSVGVKRAICETNAVKLFGLLAG